MKYLKNIIEQMKGLTNVQKKFMITLLGTILTLRGKMTFTNMSRYSELSEKTYRRHFSKKFEYEEFNKKLIAQAFTGRGRQIAVMDASFIKKSGGKTYGKDYFFNGCAGRAEKGLEISVISIVDVDAHIGYSLSVRQTPAQIKTAPPLSAQPSRECPVVAQPLTTPNKRGRPKKPKSSPPQSDKVAPENSRMDFYLEHIKQAQPYLAPTIRYLVVDGAYAKQKYVQGVCQQRLHIISKLRDDANLRHLYTEPQIKRRGAPRKYKGKVKLSSLSGLTFVGEVEPNIALYTAVVNSVSLKRNIRLAYLLDRRCADKLRYALLFSTDIDIDPKDIWLFYKSRFQIEFIFRDAKQFTGLADCQSPDKDKLDFHFNASLSALNLAKLEAFLHHSSDDHFVFSMDNSKRFYFNNYLLNLFISMFDLDPTFIKNHPNYSLLLACGSIAA